MPEIARLGSIIIRVYADDSWRHYQPHFHAVTPDTAMVVRLPDLAVIAGGLRRGRDVVEWARQPDNLHRLIEAWNAGNSNRSIPNERHD